MIALFASVVIAAGPTTLAFVGLGPADAAAPILERVLASTAADSEVVPLETLRLRLVGTPVPRTPDIVGLRKMVADAVAREARFDSAGARALRQQVLHAFDAAVYFAPELRQVALAATLDTVAALVGDGRREASEALARDTVRRFGRLDIDAARYPPAVRELFVAAESAVRAQPRSLFDVQVDAAGRLFADAVALGEVTGRQRFELPVGSYRLWLVDGSGRSSLPYPVTLGTSPVVIELDSALDALLEVDPVVAVRCESACDQALQRLGRRLKVAAVVGVRPGPDGRVGGMRVEVASGSTSPWEPAAAGSEGVAATLNGLESSTRARFTPLYLVPFGVGQFVQDRPVFGAGWATAELGLLAWHLVALKRHSSALGDRDFDREPALRRQRNLSAGLFYGTVVAGVVEAVVVGFIAARQ